MMRRIASLRRRLRQESGLSLIEMLVALGILFVSMLALARTATLAFTDVGFARQRQTADQLANRTLEEIRGLPYDTVAKGLSDSDLAGDPAIVSCDGAPYFQVCPPDGEPLVHTPGLPTTVPLVPHRADEVFRTTYHRAVYVTTAADAPSAGALRVTVVVTWDAARVRGEAARVEAQTLVFSPNGCVDTATHPFGAPCQPYFFGSGTAGGGGVEATGTVENLTFESVTADFLRETADAQVEQVTRVEGSSRLPRVMTVVGGAITDTGRTGTSLADSDPSNAVPTYSTGPVGPQPGGSVLVEGGGHSLSATVQGSESGRSTSTVSANATNACASQLDNLPCGVATGNQTGTGVMSLFLAESVGNANLLVSGTSSTQVQTYARRMVPTGTIGLLRERVDWNLPTISIGGLPTGVSQPSGWSGYWVRLTGFSASAQAEAGAGTVAPSVSVTGQIQAWNGTGYTSTPVTASGAELNVTPIDRTVRTDTGNEVRVQISGSVNIGASNTTEATDASGARTKGRAEVGAPLDATISYRITRDNVVIADLTLRVNAGRAVASTFYRAAPS